MANLAQIYDWFMTGKKPTQAQFWASWGSFWNKEETIPQSAISNLTTVLAAKTENDQFNAHKVALDAHTNLFLGKEDKDQKGAAGGYTPLNEFTKIASEYLNIVNDVVTGGATSLASAETVKTLKNQINAINLLLTSDNVNLDNVQEIVDAIENVQTSLSTILVNDLITGGTTKALTAEMGKTLMALIYALTTVVGNKVDKVSGERLINAGEITKLAGLGSIATTVKPILSNALATQNVAGFVTYINSLNPVLVIGASEIVKYNLTDTGRVFELNLRGRSFGTGQPAIVAADVLEVTDFLNKDIKLSNYPSTRNDGQLPTNKVLAPDANGNVKLYSIAIAPAPWIKELIPDSYLPDTTGNIRIIGDFFTPEMCNRITNPNAIIIGGVATIHYANFVNSQEILANVTTGSVEGNFSITLNNGLQTVKANALLIVLGTVFKPEPTDWINIVEPIDVDTIGEAKVQNSYSRGTAVWSKVLNTSINFEIRFNMKQSPLISRQIVFGESDPLIGDWRNFSVALIHNAANNEIMFDYGNFRNAYILLMDKAQNIIVPQLNLGNQSWFGTHKVRYVNGIWYFYYENVLKLTSTINNNLTTNAYIKFAAHSVDIENIKYIELAS